MKIFGIHIYESAEEVGFIKGFDSRSRNLADMLKMMIRSHKKYPRAMSYKKIVLCMKNILKNT